MSEGSAQPTFAEWHLAVSKLAMECSFCGPALRCPKCGNNECNAGYGEVDGVTCDLCPSIYSLQDFIAKQLWDSRSPSGSTPKP